MKRSLSTPVVAATLIVVIVTLTMIFYRGMTSTPNTPRPSAAMFGGKPSIAPGK